MNELESYFLGVIWGDGSLDKNRIKIHCHSEEVLWHNILFRLVKECFNVIPTLYEHKYCKETDIYINSKNAVSKYVEYKVAGLWYLPPIFDMRYILAGLIDTDGSFSLVKRKKGRIGDWARSGNIAISNKENAEFVKSMFVFHGLPLRLSKSGKVFIVPFYGYKSFNFVSENIPIKHPHKRQKLLEILNSYKKYSWGLHGLVGEV